MRLLHTSDWHIGRTFHGHSTLDALAGVLGALAATVADERIDAVLVAGDVFDSAAPSGDAFRVFEEAVGAIRDAGAVVVMTAGNHDSPRRLGHNARFAAAGGVHVLVGVDDVVRPVRLTDEHGAVLVYGIPYLDPVAARAAFPDAGLTTHEAVHAHALGRIQADAAERDPAARVVVLAHCFAAGVAEADAASDVVRDITSGGLDVVPVSLFTAPPVAYAALGHIHGRAELAPTVRYSGAPLHYSFSERGPRGAWLVDLAADAVAVRWSPLPVPRRLVTIEGELQSVLDDPAHADAEDAWVRAVLTDPERPMDAMRRLQRRFPHCATLDWRPPERSHEARAYAERVRARRDDEIVDAFLADVRGGAGLDEAERAIVAALLAEEQQAAAL